MQNVHAVDFDFVSVSHFHLIYMLYDIYTYMLYS
jgi:hypothetical protein